MNKKVLTATKGVIRLAGFKNTIMNLILFKEPKEEESFTLKENENRPDEKDKRAIEDNDADKNIKNKSEPQREEKPSILKKNNFQETEQKEEEKGPTHNEKEKKISKKLSENLDYIKMRYTIPKNGDVILREFEISVKENSIAAFIVFFDGMTDRKVIDDDILQPLMLLSNLDIKSKNELLADYIRNHLLTHNQIKEFKTYREVIDEINFGGCGIFVDGMDSVFAGDVKGWEHRTVERPNTELVIRGPQEGFVEILRVNTALVRKILKDEDMIVENASVGERSKTPVSIMYIKDIANDSLVAEVRRRINSIKVDYVHDSGEIEQFIEDSSFIPVPQIIATERPDRVAAMLGDGKVAVMVHGSPFALIMPTTFHELLHSPEDSYIRFPYSNLLRGIRILAFGISLLLPGIYVAITNFHQEMIPTDLLLAIEASREKVPFPTVVEILIMEVAFELIREAGIRIPGPIGPTLGIIGALILGQAAVAANIVSPILIIIVAVTGIGSFAAPNFSMAFATRILRFGYIFLGAMAGFLGISTGIFIQGLYLVNAKSFGVPFLAPFGPLTKGSLTDSIVRAPIWRQEKRPDYINPKDYRKQPVISRKWTEGGSKGEKNNEK